MHVPQQHALWLEMLGVSDERDPWGRLADWPPARGSGGSARDLPHGAVYLRDSLFSQRQSPAGGAGIAINAATRADFNTYHLPGKMQFRFVPDSPTAEMTKEYKAEFTAWAIGNALREVIEGAGGFLDRICSVCVELSRISNQSDVSDFYQSFERKGVARKLRDLASQFEIKLHVADGFDSLTAARNCLTHRRGLVEARDCNEAGKLVVRYWEPAIIIQQPDGSEMRADKAINEAMVLKEGGVLAMQIQEMAKEFQIGSLIKLTSETLRISCGRCGLPHSI